MNQDPVKQNPSTAPEVREHRWLALAPTFIRRRLADRPYLRRTIDSALWVMLDKVIRLGLGVVVMVWIARYLGPEQFGALNFAIAFIALFSVFSNLGMQGVIVRDLVTRPDRRDCLLGSALLLRVAGSVLAMAATIVMIRLLRPTDSQSWAIVTIVAYGLIPQAWDLIDYEFQADVNSRPVVIIRNVSFLVFSAGKVMLIVRGGTLRDFAWLQTGELVLVALLLSVLARARGKLPRISQATRAEILYLLRTCWPLIISGLSVALYMRIDQVMLGKMAGDSVVGVFSAAVRVSEVWYFIPVAIMSALTPGLTAIYNRSRREYWEKLAHTSRLLVWLGIAVALSLTVLSGPLVLALYGPRYAGAASILAVHGWAGIFAVLGLVGSSCLLNQGLLYYSMYQTALGALTNIALNMVLIPRLGGLGAAISTIAGYAVAGVLANGVFSGSRDLVRVQLLSLIPWKL